MPKLSITQLVQEWYLLRTQTSESTQAVLKDITQTHAAELAQYFYAQMLNHPVAAAFLKHDQVKSRLSHTMSQWVVTVFSAHSEAELIEVIELQHKVGLIHARIELPVSLVMRGARWLKKRLIELVEQRTELEQSQRHAVCHLGTQIMDLAIEIMCVAFSQSHDRNSRAEEAYRLFSVSQNIGAERERQRAALLDWENQLMFDLTLGDSHVQLAKIASSEFGMWFRHKASHAFEGAPETNSILSTLQTVDELVPTLLQADGQIDLARLREVRLHSKSIRFLLDSLFEQASSLEAGRDVLTRLLNRRFLPVVMAKEINYSRQSHTQFAALMIDLDHFKAINDQYGHDMGDNVLQQLASVLASNVRGGDYAFRLGGEEFLVVLVDIDAGRAVEVADKLRMLIEAETFTTEQGTRFKASVSIGVAVHDGHPDYERLLKQADQALYQAKREGRNRVVLA